MCHMSLLRSLGIRCNLILYIFRAYGARRCGIGQQYRGCLRSQGVCQFFDFLADAFYLLFNVIISEGQQS
jgi:hypothetical protein